MEYHDSMLIEKIMVDIAERATSFVEASRACILWLKLCNIRSCGFKGHVLQKSHRWPVVDVNGSVIPCERNLEKLHRIFYLAKNEMDRTKSKYNRYTRFAFVFLDALLASLDEMSSNIKHSAGSRVTTVRSDCNQSVNYMLQRIWDDIVSVEFIWDYLSRPLLRDFQEPIATTTELIMADALHANGSLNMDRLMLMVEYSHILFDFVPIFFELTALSNWNQQTRAECLEFIVDQRLITWSAMKTQLRDLKLIYFGDPIMDWMWNYVYSRHLEQELPGVIQVNPFESRLLRRSAAEDRSSRNRVSLKENVKRFRCCLCM